MAQAQARLHLAQGERKQVEEEAAASFSAREGGSITPSAAMLAQAASPKGQAALKSVIDTALLEVDPKTGHQVGDPSRKWKVFNTHDKHVEVIYRHVDTDSTGVLTLRSSMDMACTPEQIFAFFDCGYNDDLALSLETDKLMQSYRVAKQYDDDHCLVHACFSAGVPKRLVKHRDFCWIKRRVKFDNYVPGCLDDNYSSNGQSDEKTQNKEGIRLAGFCCHSVDETHPDFVEREHKHVRGWIHYSGCAVVPKTDKICTVRYVVCVDPCGKIPKRVVNIAAPIQGLNIKIFAKSIEKVKKMLAERAKKEKKGT